MNKRSVGFLALTFFLGILVGSVLGQAIGLFLPEEGIARELFVTYHGFSIGPTPINLVALVITLGLEVKVNLMSVVGIFVVAQLLRWFR